MASPAAAVGPVSTVRETQTLRPSAGAAKLASPFILAPNDWILPPGYRVANLFFYARPADTPAESFMPVPRLIEAMQRVLAHYPLLSACFVRNDANGTIELDLESDKCGVPFVSAEAECTIDSLPLSQEAYTATRVLPASLQLVHNFNYAAPLGEPAWAIQYTRFACGGVCLGVHMHHILGDASSFFQVMADWIRCYNDGSDAWLAANPPTLDRAMFRWSPEEVTELLKGHEEDGYLVPSTPRAGWTPGPPNVARVFLFGAEELKAMKEAATPSKEEAAKSDKDGWVSTMEALSAHMIRCVYMARNPDASASAAAAAATPESDASLANLAEAFAPSTLKYHIATNWRPRLTSPAAPPRFFGNGALYTPVLLPDPLALVRNTLRQNANLVHRAIARNDSRHLRGTMAWITAQPIRSAIVPNFALSGLNDFAITAWHRFGCYAESGAFGGVMPLRVCQPSFPGMDGICILMTGRPSEGTPAAAGASPASPHGSVVEGESIEMILGLTEEAMARLEANPEWRKFKPQ